MSKTDPRTLYVVTCPDNRVGDSDEWAVCTVLRVAQALAREMDRDCYLCSEEPGKHRVVRYGRDGQVPKVKPPACGPRRQRIDHR